MEAEGHSCFPSVMFMWNCVTPKAKEILKKCTNEHNKGVDSYPATIDKAHKLTHHHRLEVQPQTNNKNQNNKKDDDTSGKGAVFAVSELNDHAPGKDGKALPGIKCYECNKKGHKQPQCPKRTGRTGSSDNNAGEETSNQQQQQQQQGEQNSPSQGDESTQEQSQQSQQGANSVCIGARFDVLCVKTHVPERMNVNQRTWSSSLSKAVDALDRSKQCVETDLMSKASRLASTNVSLATRMKG